MLAHVEAEANCKLTFSVAYQMRSGPAWASQ